VACPVAEEADTFAWMLTRTRPPLGQQGETLVGLLAAILATLLGVALAVTLMLRRVVMLPALLASLSARLLTGG
jgi:two-component system, NtrC family, sensor histidine kinase HydH